MALQKYTKEWLEELCKDSYSYAEVLQKAGRKQGGGSQATLKNKIELFGIDVSHFTGQIWTKSPNHADTKIVREKYSIEEIFVKNSPVTQKIMRGYVERHQLLEYKCQKCGNLGFWQGEELKLEIHHQDGDNTNNELENLCYLCPNCHSQTENFRARNMKNGGMVE